MGGGGNLPILANLGDNGWELENGEEYANRSPETFKIPERTQRENLKAGDVVKLIFQSIPDEEEYEGEKVVERMWVFVKGKRENFYFGEIDNDSVSTGKLHSGTEIWFLPEHVIAIYQEEKK